ncbi:carbonic anhydrase [Falsiroseomonas ponticola]|uniref:carbonic anhydrase n=1 Tax=Falsiroseomonas ponticola TaxID=2786951 RepID=UPI00193402C3|nr:carbonic anhydrase [Roseomonas ponticola]
MTPVAPDASKADAFVLSCIDPRLVDDVTQLLATMGRTNRYSEMRIAGAALAAVDEARPGWNSAVWDNLAASRQLHGVRRVIIINHRDCGAMNLWAGRNLAADPVEEERQHQAVMDRAAAEVLRRHPDMAVELHLMALDGSTQRLPCAACNAAAERRLDTMRPMLRAEAVAPPPPPSPPAGAPAFAELVRLRLSGGLADAEAERALLTEGVTRYGLTAAEARAALAAEATRHGATPSTAARQVVVFLRAQADGKGRVSRRDVGHAASLYHGLAGNQGRRADADRAVAKLMEAEGLSPRPDGVLRTTTWYRRLAEA